MKTTFMNTSVASVEERSPESAPFAPSAAFIAGSILFHMALVLALNGVPRQAAPEHRDVSVDFTIASPEPAPVAPAVQPEPEVAPFAVRAQTVSRTEIAPPSPPTEAPQAEAPAPELAPLAMATALPADAQGDLAVQTGTGGAGVLGHRDQAGLSHGGSADGTALAVASTPAAPAVDRRALLREWTLAVNRILLERARRQYPRSAIEARREGTVTLAITIDPRGHISAVSVQRSSGHEVLDDSALATVRDVGEVPAPPEALGWQSRAVPMPIVYRVR